MYHQGKIKDWDVYHLCPFVMTPLWHKLPRKQCNDAWTEESKIWTICKSHGCWEMPVVTEPLVKGGLDSGEGCCAGPSIRAGPQISETLWPGRYSTHHSTALKRFPTNKKQPRTAMRWKRVKNRKVQEKGRGEGRTTQRSKRGGACKSGDREVGGRRLESSPGTWRHSTALNTDSKAVPTSPPDLEESRTTSAGRYCPLTTLTMSPTAT